MIEFFIGICLFFLGLYVMNLTVEEMKSDSKIDRQVSGLNIRWFFQAIMLMGLGLYFIFGKSDLF